MDYSQYKHLELRRKFFVLAGAKIHVSEPASGAQVGYIQMKAWKLREDIRLYTGEDMQHEVFTIHAQSIIDFGNTYDVLEPATSQKLFSFRRKGFKSLFVRDHWDIFDTTGNAIGAVQETSSALALLRRWIGVIPIAGELADLVLMFAPQTYDVLLTNDSAQTQVAHLVHQRNPFIVRISLDTSMAPSSSDPRLTLAAGSLLSTIDAAKQ
jgi:hypothetical protein